MSGFAPVGSSQVSVVMDPGSGADTPVIVNLPLTANVESSYAFPSGTTQFQVKLRDSSGPMQIAFTPGGTSTTYLTVPRSCFYGESGLLATGLIIYAQTAVSGATLEVLSWS